MIPATYHEKYQPGRTNMDPYTGPYWSDGKIQSSVEFGESFTPTYLAYNSRLHDSAFAHFQDDRHRTAADWIYRQSLRFDDSVKSQIVRQLPFVGNHVGFLLPLFTSGLAGPAALLAALEVSLLKRDIENGAYDSEIRDVLQFYNTDPDPLLSKMGGALTSAVYPDWSNQSQEYKDRVAWANEASQPKPGLRGTKEDTVVVPIPPAPTVYDGKPKLPPITPGTNVPTSNGGTVVPTNPTIILPPIDRSDLSAVLTRGEELSATLAYTPYRPLAPLVRRPPDARTVQLYNKYNKKKITLDEALHKFYGTQN